MNSTIKVENLNFYYDKFHALKDINIEIEKNKITALIGPSGCGKSTFIRTINRMNDIIDKVNYTGKIMFEDENVLDPEYDIFELRKRVGMVFQKPNPFTKSIYDNITHAPKYHGQRNKQVLNELVETSLKKASIWNEVKDNLKKSALELSGGQQQRICIARCIAMKPDIILMDEPTSALDPIATLNIEELMESLKKEHTIVIVTHSMEQAARISDNVAFFLNGEIVEFGKTEELFAEPKNPLTRDYITGRFS